MALDVSSIPSIHNPIFEGPRQASAVHAPPSDAAAATPPSAQVQAMIRDLERVSSTFNRRLSFSFNEKLGEVIVKVIDNETDKVVREIPPAELQRVYERIREVIGLLFDERA